MVHVLAALFVLVHAATPVEPWARLRTLIPASTCNALFTDRTSYVDPVDELLDLMRLRHPLIQRYLELNTQPHQKIERAFHVDVRLLALIFGDQPVFDLQTSGTQSPFAGFERAARRWWLTPRSARRAHAVGIVEKLTDLDWSVRDVGDNSTVYLDGFRIERAFRTDRRPFWASLVARFWDVNDRENVTLLVHRRIFALRSELAGNEDLRRRLIDRLAERTGRTALPQVLKPTRRLLKVFAAYVDRLPPPDLRWIEDVRRRARGVRPTWPR